MNKNALSIKTHTLIGFIKGAQQQQQKKQEANRKSYQWPKLEY